MIGFTKTMRNGIITMDDYDDQHLEVARHHESGLFMVRIDHLKPNYYRIGVEICTDLRLEEDNVIFSESENEESRMPPRRHVHGERLAHL